MLISTHLVRRIKEGDMRSYVITHIDEDGSRYATDHTINIRSNNYDVTCNYCSFTHISRLRKLKKENLQLNKRHVFEDIARLFRRIHKQGLEITDLRKRLDKGGL